jgi:riboflavin kinase / FMN adenylyltransferase
MRVVRGDGRSHGLPEGAAVTIGNFDGLHRGQRTLVEHVVGRAAELAAAALVLTFDPHPLRVLAPEREPARLSSDRQRQALLAAAGVEVLWLVPFTVELAAWEPERFVRELLVESLGAREVAVGSAFRFGRNRAGDVALLRRLGVELGFAVTGMPEQADAAGTVSSTRIRRDVAAGEMESAAALLGRPYAIDGEVVQGDQLGRSLGWPTANIAPADPRLLLPATGVYAAKLALLRENRSVAGVANLGTRPTRADAGGMTLEIHLFDFAGDLYGEAVELAFLRRLRPERRFESLAALREQIGRDAAQAREYFLRESR